MNLETSKKILRIAGILSIVGAVFMLVLSAIALIGGGSVASQPGIEADEELQQTVAGAFVGGFLFLFIGIAGLAEGIVSYLAGKTGKKGLATASMVFAAITTINLVSNLIKSAGTTSNVLNSLFSIALNLLSIYAAYVVRKAAEPPPIRPIALKISIKTAPAIDKIPAIRRIFLLVSKFICFPPFFI